MTVVPAPPAPDPRGRRHSMRTVRLARQMYGNGDAWTPKQIQRYLAGEGIDVALYTVRTWVVPGEAEIARRRNLESYYRRQRGGRASKTPMLTRMLELRDAGLSFSAIAKVMRLDHGLDMSTEMARYYVNERREPSRRCAARVAA